MTRDSNNINEALRRDRLDLENKFRDPVLRSNLTRLCEDAAELTRLSHDLGANDEDMGTQLGTWELVAASQSNELFVPIINFLYLSLSEKVRNSWEDQHGTNCFEAGLVECLGVCPSVFKTESGFVILMPLGFLEFAQTFQAEVEHIAGNGIYYMGMWDRWPQKTRRQSMDRLSNFLEILLRNDVNYLNYGRTQDENLWPLPNLDRRNRILKFIIAHEITHAFRNHFIYSSLLGYRNQERFADGSAFLWCIQAEEMLYQVLSRLGKNEVENTKFLSPIEKVRILKALDQGQEGYERYMYDTVAEYIIACKAFFATVYLLERTIGFTRLAEDRRHSHPNSLDRSFYLWLTYGQTRRYFGLRRMGFLQRHILGKAFWRLARLFLHDRGQHIQGIIKSNDEREWSGRANVVRSAIEEFF